MAQPDAGADLGERIVAALKTRGWWLATAESCTAGMLANRVAGFNGASHVYVGGVIAYRKEAKTALLGVPEAMMSRPSGAVSAEVAEAMAEGARQAAKADIAVATTGVAGPQQDEDGNPVGLVYLGLADGAGSRSRRLDLGAQRPDAICRKAVETALVMVAEALEDDPSAAR